MVSPFHLIVVLGLIHRLKKYLNPNAKLWSAIPNSLLPSWILGHQRPWKISYRQIQLTKLKYFYKEYLIYLFSIILKPQNI